MAQAVRESDDAGEIIKREILKLWIFGRSDNGIDFEVEFLFQSRLLSLLAIQLRRRYGFYWYC